MPVLTTKSKKGPLRRVVRYVVEKTQGAETCRVVARLECGHSIRVNAGRRPGCRRCPYCDE